MLVICTEVIEIKHKIVIIKPAIEIIKPDIGRIKYANAIIKLILE